MALTGELALTVSEHKKCSLFSEDLCSVHTVSSVAYQNTRSAAYSVKICAVCTQSAVYSVAYQNTRSAACSVKICAVCTQSAV